MGIQLENKNGLEQYKLPTQGKGLVYADLTKILPPLLQKSKYASALAASIQAKQGALILSSGKTTGILALVKTMVETKAIKEATGSVPSSDTKKAILAVNRAYVGEQAAYQKKVVDTVISPLAEGTIIGDVKTEQLEITTGAYTDLQKKYDELLKSGSGDIDIKQLLIYGGIAVVGIIALSFLIKR